MTLPFFRVALQLAVAGGLLLTTACGGGGGGGGGTTPGGSPTSIPTAAALVATSFVFNKPTTTSVHRRANDVTAAVASIKIALVSVNGTAATAFAPVTTNINVANCPCTIPGPSVPAGFDVFTLTAYDAANGNGNVVSTASPALTIVAGQTNVNTIALNGVPASLSVALPAGTAGTAFAATPFTVTVKDADGNTIMGAYANPVLLTDGDTSGATTLATSGSDAPPAGELLSSGDTATLAYSGLAIAPIAVGASVNGATAGATFAPALQPIGPSSLTGGVTINPPGAASPLSFTAAEIGWTNAPYNRSLTATLSAACSTIATIAPVSGTTFTATLVASPANGSCTLTLADGVGQSLTIPLGYQLFSYTGGSQAFTVPTGISSLTIVATGGQGGTAATSNGFAGGKGGSATVTTTVTAGTSLAIVVGGMGGTGNVLLGGTAGFGDGSGGIGGPAGTVNGSGGGGGGGSSVRSGSSAIVIAGGGGGEGGRGSANGGAGGGNATGAGAVGAGADGSAGTSSTGGHGGASVGGGAGISIGGGCIVPFAGLFNPGTGGAGGGTGCGVSGGAGGGGYAGGGGGGGDQTGSNTAAGGGGGSSFAATSVGSATLVQGTQSGNGQVIFTW